MPELIDINDFCKDFIREHYLQMIRTVYFVKQPGDPSLDGGLAFFSTEPTRITDRQAIFNNICRYCIDEMAEEFFSTAEFATAHPIPSKALKDIYSSQIVHKICGMVSQNARIPHRIKSDFLLLQAELLSSSLIDSEYYSFQNIELIHAVSCEKEIIESNFISGEDKLFSRLRLAEYYLLSFPCGTTADDSMFKEMVDLLVAANKQITNDFRGNVDILKHWNNVMKLVSSCASTWSPDTLAYYNSMMKAQLSSDNGALIIIKYPVPESDPLVLQRASDDDDSTPSVSPTGR